MQQLLKAKPCFQTRGLGCRVYGGTKADRQGSARAFSRCHTCSTWPGEGRREVAAALRRLLARPCNSMGGKPRGAARRQGEQLGKAPQSHGARATPGGQEERPQQGWVRMMSAQHLWYQQRTWSTQGEGSGRALWVQVGWRRQGQSVACSTQTSASGSVLARWQGLIDTSCV